MSSSARLPALPGMLVQSFTLEELVGMACHLASEQPDVLLEDVGFGIVFPRSDFFERTGLALRNAPSSLILLARVGTI